jgi:transitional endoplasmic reticulum ATPase
MCSSYGQHSICPNTSESPDPDHSDIMSATYGAHEKAFALWADHVSARRVEPEFFTQDLLAKAYNGYHIARTSPTTCDLLEYAKAGHATATQVIRSDHDATRVYRAPASRIEGQTGKLEDAISFGRWDYTWNNYDFIIYETAHIDRFARVIKLLYILAPQSDKATHETHHPQTDHLLLRSGEWTTSAHERIWVFDNAKWSKDKHLWDSVQSTSWEDVVVSPTVKRKLSLDIDGFFDSRSLYEKSKIPWKRGIIFHGVPGVGKTLFIKMLIKSLSERSPPIPTLYVKSLDACSGPKWSIQQIFQKARRTAPCLLVLEDLDSLVQSHTRSYFLNEVDGLSSNDGILMIGSTNHLDQLDPAVTKRPSRFDRKYHFDLPTETERMAYCRYWRQKYIESGEVDFPNDICVVVAKATNGFTFAYLKELFVSSLLLLVRSATDGLKDSIDDEDAITKDDELKSGVPEVDIPAHIQNNRLLKIIVTQVQGLLEDMNSTEITTPGSSSTAGAPNPNFRLPSLLDEPDE